MNSQAQPGVSLLHPKPNRKLTSWIDGFERWTSIFPSPPIFRLWAGISVLSAALERRVWVRAFELELYPNLYIILVGPPGAGKGIIPQAELFIRSVPEAHVAPSATSPQGLFDAITDAKRIIARPGKDPAYVEYNYLTIIAEELGVLLPAYDPLFLNFLQRLFDGNFIEERKRTKAIHVKVPKPQVSILGGTTPSYLNGFVPEGAWDQGFTSRTLFIFSGDRQIKDPFVRIEDHDKLARLYSDLSHDLKMVTELFGEVHFTPSAQDLFRRWHMAGGPPVPTHGKLTHYAARRSQHLFKLCMVASVSRGDSLEVVDEDFGMALDWLLEAERLMPDIFQAVANGGDSSVMEDTWFKMVKFGRPVPQYIIIQWLADRVPAYAVAAVFTNMKATEMIRLEKAETREVMNLWVPNPRR